VWDGNGDIGAGYNRLGSKADGGAKGARPRRESGGESGGKCPMKTDPDSFAAAPMRRKQKPQGPARAGAVGRCQLGPDLPVRGASELDGPEGGP
jgi:hypothetical protein